MPGLSKTMLVKGAPVSTDVICLDIDFRGHLIILPMDVGIGQVTSATHRDVCIHHTFSCISSMFVWRILDIVWFWLCSVPLCVWFVTLRECNYIAVRYNAVNFHRNAHKKKPVTHTGWRDMGNLFEYDLWCIFCLNHCSIYTKSNYWTV